MSPTPITFAAACPWSGQGIWNFSPPNVYAFFSPRLRVASGSGRTSWTTQKTISSRMTSGVQILNRRTTVRTGVSGGGGVFVSCASRSSGIC